jgi:hypothetical protein
VRRSELPWPGAARRRHDTGVVHLRRNSHRDNAFNEAASAGGFSDRHRCHIAGGTVTPTNAQAQAVAGRPIPLAVSSDVVDELHVHSVPEHTFDVDARPDQQFEFTVEVPGRVDVELHDLHRTVVTIEVLP